MKTYLTHTLSLAMMPALAADDLPTQFSWDFELLTEEMAMTLIAQAQRRGQFSNHLTLGAMDNIMHQRASEYHVDLEEQSRSRMHLAEGDTLIVVKYRGRKLDDHDHHLPPASTLRYYKMTCAKLEYAAWENTILATPST